MNINEWGVESRRLEGLVKRYYATGICNSVHRLLRRTLVRLEQP